NDSNVNAETSPHAVAADGEVGVALAALAQVAGHDLASLHTDDGAAPRFGDDVVGDQRSAGTGRDRHADADVGAAHHVAGRGDVAQVVTEAEHDAGSRRVLDHIAGDGRIGLDIKADAGAVAGVGAARTLRQEVADQVALHHSEPAALVEIGDRDAD